jgi:hypothetical protein
LLGWHGITLITPRDWNLATFGGTFRKGNLRLTDDEGVRLEMVWEEAKSTPNVARSIELLLQNIEREAKKKKHHFALAQNPKVLSKSRREHADKEQISSFGWIGDKAEPVAHGWGAAWFCLTSNRVIVAHLPGRGTENPDKTRRLASEVLNSCVSHATGGWQTWSVFDLQLEVPEEFQLVSAKLQTGRLELDWERVKVPAMDQLFSFRELRQNWGRRPERVGLRRISAANVVLENETLEAWTGRVAAHMFKPFRFASPQPQTVLGRNGFEMKGAQRDLRSAIRLKILDIILRRQTPPPYARIWQDEEANKNFVLLFDLRSENAHVAADILDSIQSA